MSRLGLLLLALLLSAAASTAGTPPSTGSSSCSRPGARSTSPADVLRAGFEDAAAFIRKVARGKRARNAREVARKAGYDLARYDGFFYCTRNTCPFAGLGTGNKVWLNGSADGELVVHEIGTRASNHGGCTTRTPCGKAG